MTQEKERELLSSYRSLFESDEILSDPKQSCMCWGFECGDGWYNVIDKMLKRMKALKDPELYLTQVKEKWGLLRVYTNFSTKKVEKIISKAEKESAHVCEQCGSKKYVSTHADFGWYRTLCPICREAVLEKMRKVIGIK